MRYIEIDSIIEQIKAEHCDRCNHNRCALCDLDDVLLKLEEADDADVEEVKHGKWIAKERTSISKRGRVIHYSNHKCSICGKWNGRHKPNYCPNCGAKMDERKGE